MRVWNVLVIMLVSHKMLHDSLLPLFFYIDKYELYTYISLYSIQLKYNIYDGQ